MNTKELKERRQQQLEVLKNFCLLDDDFMTKFFEDLRCTELVVRIILRKPDIKVIECRSQVLFKNLQNRSACLDIFATDSTGRKYNIEIQRSDKGGAVKRARYNSALVDANITKPGESYEDLPESYVIFITENDVLGKGLPIYHIDRTIRETQKPFNDGAHIIYVNAAVQDESDLGKLMQDFRCKEADKINYEPLAKRFRYLKETPQGVNSMCRAVEELCAKVEARGEARGVAKGRIEVMVKGLKSVMKNGKLTLEEAMKLMGVPAREKAKYEKLISTQA